MSVNKVVDCLVGLQFGSESKGKLSSLISHKYDALCRSGSINAAHTAYYNGKAYTWHQLPTGVLHAPKAKIVLGAGAQISPERLHQEIGWLKENNCWLGDDGQPRLFIDPNATVIDAFDLFAENGYQELCGERWYRPTECVSHNGTTGALGGKKAAGTCEGCELYPKDSAHRAIGSTTHGSGMNLIRKLARGTAMIRDNKGEPIKAPTLAKDHPACKEYLRDTVDLLNTMVDRNQPILVEGTQGAGLSLHFGTVPWTTSRDTNASNWFTEMGLAPTSSRTVYGVCRTFPIRVAGNSGPTGAPETTWEQLTKYTNNLPDDWTQEQLDTWLKDNNKKMIIERTSATRRYRRIFWFSINDFRRAVQLNRPDEIMLSFADYLDASNYGKNKWEDLTEKSRKWIERLEAISECHFKYISTGPEETAIIIR